MKVLDEMDDAAKRDWRSLLVLRKKPSVDDVIPNARRGVHCPPGNPGGIAAQRRCPTPRKRPPMNAVADAKLARCFARLDEVGDQQVVDLAPIKSWPATRHRFAETDLWALRAALAAGRPLLVRGEPGIGKSQLARAAAQVLGLPFVYKVIDARCECSDLLYEYDAVARLAQAQIIGQTGAGQDWREQLLEAHFVRPGILWWAFAWGSARDAGGTLPPALARCGAGPRPTLPRAVPARGLEPRRRLRGLDRRDRQGGYRRPQRPAGGPRQPGLRRPVHGRGRGPGRRRRAAAGRRHHERGTRVARRLRAPLPGASDERWTNTPAEKRGSSCPAAATISARRSPIRPSTSGRPNNCSRTARAVTGRGLAKPGAAEYIDLLRR